jgi:hypothetical protein
MRYNSRSLFPTSGGRDATLRIVKSVSSWDANDKKAYTFRKASGVDPQALAQFTDRFGSIDKDRALDLMAENTRGVCRRRLATARFESKA